MTLPGDLTTTILTATVLDCAGHPLSGSLTVTPSTDVTDATGAVVIPMAERVYPISAQGTIRTDALVSTDNETLDPQGWTYGLSLQIAGLAPKNWSIQLPHSAEPVDISGITPVVPQPDVISYVSLTGGDMTGLLTLDGGLKIPAGAADGDVLTSDADGNASWALPTGGSGHHDGGSVTDVSVVTANGFAGTVASEDTTPAITVSTTVTGLLKGNGTAVSAAVSGTDYDAPGAAAAAQAAAQAASVPRSGGTMTGPLTLNALDLEDGTTARGGFQSIAGDLWILANATWDGSDWHRIDVTKAAFGFQIQGQNNIFGEPVPGATMWVAQPESYTLIRGGGSPSGDQFTAVGGWELGYTLTSQRQLTVGGAGIEIDGYGTFPYGRVVSSTTGSVLSRHLAGMVRNAYPQMDGDDTDLQESWFWGYVDQFDSVTPSNNNADGYLTGTNHWSVAYLPAGSISSFSGTFDEYLKISPNGATGIVEVSADPTTNLGVATKQYVDGTVAAGAPNAGASTLGLVELNTDLGGTATAPHVVATHLTAGLPVNQGGTGTNTTAAAAYNALSPMTTTGDIEYESGTGTASRLAGNTTSTKKFLTQTGTGSVSAAPGWNTIATGDVPTLNQNTTGTAAGLSSTLVIASGGTAATSFTAYAPVVGGTTSTGALQAVSNSGATTGQVLTYQGTSSLPTWTTVSGGSGGASVLTTSYGTASHTLDASADGAFFLTLTGNPTLSFTGSVSGTELSCTVYLKQDGTGSRTVTWSGVKWQDAIPPALSTGANAVDILVFTSPDGSTWYGSLAAVNMS